MKIVLIHNDFRVYWKGRLRFLRTFLAGHDVSFHAVELFGEGSPYTFDERVSGFDWWECIFPKMEASRISSKDIVRSVGSALDRLDADLVIAPSIVFYAGALGLRWAKRNQRRFIMFDDARPSGVRRNRVVQFVKNLLTSQADGLWLPSAEYEADWGHFKAKGVHFFYGYNTIDNIRFSPRQPNTYTHRVVLCVARLVPIKNLDNLLRAWKLVENSGSDCRLEIVGSGPDEDRLVHLQRELRLRNVRFAGAIGNDELPAKYASADAFILPSLTESWGLAVNEAMSAGLPILLSTGVNAARSLLREGVNGFGFNPFDVAEMAGAILKFTSLSLAIKTKMGAAASKDVDRFSYSRMGEALLEALGMLITAPKRASNGVTRLVINNWNGRYNTGGWDRAEKVVRQERAAKPGS